MPIGGSLQGITRWQTWRLMTAADTAITDFKGANFATSKSFRCEFATAIAMRVWEQGSGATAGDEHIFNIIGFMDADRTGERGAGQKLWVGSVFAGTNTIATARPIVDNAWTSGTWREIDSFSATTDVCGASVFAGLQQGIMILPTLGYTNLMLEMTTKDANADTVGVAWRPVSYDNVI